jgi:hypothetical protein
MRLFMGSEIGYMVAGGSIRAAPREGPGVIPLSLRERVG